MNVLAWTAPYFAASIIKRDTAKLPSEVARITIDDCNLVVAIYNIVDPERKERTLILE